MLGLVHQVLQLAQIRELELEYLPLSRVAIWPLHSLPRSIPSPPTLSDRWNHIRLLSLPRRQHPFSGPRSAREVPGSPSPRQL